LKTVKHVQIIHYTVITFFIQIKNTMNSLLYGAPVEKKSSIQKVKFQ